MQVCLVDEELRHEQVVVDRVAVGKVVDVPPDIRVEGDLTIVPVMKEEIVVQRRLILTEEIHLLRVRVAGRHRETVSLRKQVAEVTRIGAGSGDITADENPRTDTTSNNDLRSTINDR